ncbi:hypothetical protein ABWF75_10795, partial [Neisseria gonorrhoeae]|uniref:hypothetical protein n=1 Tax=Neisseria gonorrhoeae TaxID=485 RepID=UPI0034E933F9
SSLTCCMRDNWHRERYKKYKIINIFFFHNLGYILHKKITTLSFCMAVLGHPDLLYVVLLCVVGSHPFVGTQQA